MMIGKILLKLSVALICFWCVDAKAQSANTISQDLPFHFSIDAERSSYQPGDLSYLGSRVGAGPIRFGLVTEDDRLDVSGINLGLVYQLPSYQIQTQIGYGFGDDQQSFGTIDLGGPTLIVPGTGIGSSGIGFGFPGPTNEITNGVLRRDFRQQNFEIAIEKTPYILSDKVSLAPALGFKYNRTETDNFFGGDLPSAGADSFFYNTEMSVQSFSPIAKLSLDYLLHPKIKLNASAYYAYDFNIGDGTDQLTLIGSIAAGTQRADLDNNDSTHSYGFRAGAQIPLQKNLDLSLDLFYDAIGNTPELDLRTGSNVSAFDYERTSQYGGRIGFTLKF
ncbi:MAG: hypothetical protein AAF549_06230 [Pseudomonadota bacterium]